MFKQKGSESKENKMTDMKLPFPWKLHNLLENAEDNKITHVVSWLPDGASFKVHHTKVFTDEIMPLYFSQTKYNSFRRQCYIYGFRLRRDGAFYHPQFIRDDIESSLSLRRNQEADRRRRKTDRDTQLKKEVLQPKNSLKLPPVPSCLNPPTGRAPSTTASRPLKAAMSLFEQTFQEEFTELSPIEEISALADKIFENNQFGSQHVDELLALGDQIDRVPIDSLNELFFSEISENPSDEDICRGSMGVVSI